MREAAPTAPIHARPVPPTYCSGLTMPRRRTTRTQDRAQRVPDEREANRLAIDEEHTLKAAQARWDAEEPIRQADSDPPPF